MAVVAPVLSRPRLLGGSERDTFLVDYEGRAVNTFIWACLIASAVLVISAAPSIDRKRIPTWFEIMPSLAQSQKQKTRLQQTAAHRKRKTRR